MADAPKGTIHSFFAQKAQSNHDRPSSAGPNAFSSLPQPPHSDGQPTPGFSQHDGRRKRRKLHEPVANEAGTPLEAAARAKDDFNESQDLPNGSEDALIQSSGPAAELSGKGVQKLAGTIHDQSHNPSTAVDAAHDVNLEPTGPGPKTPPKKMLKVNAKGTLGSPVSQKHDDRPADTTKPKRRGRPKREMHLLVRCRYQHWSQYERVGLEISRILLGETRFTLPQTPVNQPPKKKSSPRKTTHPFFRGKDKVQADQAHHNGPAPSSSRQAPCQSPRKTFASTPGKIRMQFENRKAHENHLNSDDNCSQFQKRPAITGYVSWPPRYAMHVHGAFTDLGHLPSPPQVASRKMKYRPVTIETDESVLANFRRSLDMDTDQIERLRPDGFLNPPDSLRLPKRQLIAGLQIQAYVGDQISQQDPHAQIHHAALQNLHMAIPGELTPYDLGRSEVHAWVQKYAPLKSGHVLQSGMEARLLRDWMQNLTILSVETSKSLETSLEASEPKPKKKRRKRAQDLDDFIVSDEESMQGQLEELPSSLTQDSGDLGPSSNSRTVIRSVESAVSIDARKTANAVVISGPHGCGKTAMVYAAAKELHFQVFEINSGSRRSGKDILERIGDMLGNHLVHQQSADTGNTSADEDAARLSSALKKDLDSGRQGTMNTFFKPKSKAVQKPKKLLGPSPKPDVQVQAQVKAFSKQPQRQQKQSIILLEEVDILFEEDKNFWPTVLTLIVNSKRPVVMTCTDESRLPLTAMTLHAILRLTAPPIQLATDYLLLIAAKEGHLLRRDAISSLVQQKGFDLRAAITELQLWCQMGVGDPRGGLSWIFQRWPPGTGTDQNGQPQRVTSKDTYSAGMGCLTSDLDSGYNHSDQMELLLEGWRRWENDPRDLIHFSMDMQSNKGACPIADSRKESFAALKDFDDLADSLSAMDRFCTTGLPEHSSQDGLFGPLGTSLRTTFLDPTMPELSRQARSDYVEGATLLQTDEVFDYNNMNSRIAITCCCLASKAFSSSDSSLVEPVIQRSLLVSGRTLSDSLPVQLSRRDFSVFDPISMVAASTSTYALTYSAFDGPFYTITTDVAPYVRSIVQFDLALEEQRHRLSTILGGNSTLGKRGRTTRAARSALEGGQRATTRRERWFPQELDLHGVLATGSCSWPRLELELLRSMDDSLSQGTGSHIGSQEELHGSRAQSMEL